MQVKVYLPQTVEIPSEYLPALAQRASLAIGTEAKDLSATRGHLVRQAVCDGLLRDLDSLIRADGSIDLFCDPSGEIPLEIDDRTMSLSELLQAFQGKQENGGLRNADQLGVFRTESTKQRRAA